MIYSNPRKLLLSGWLMENGKSEYNSPLKLQKFLLFYEAFAKIKGLHTDFNYLIGYQQGPVFSNVWKDYTSNRPAFNAAAQKEYSANHDQIDIDCAKRSKFIVSILSEKELSELTRKMNIWKSKETQIMQEKYPVNLYETDFNNNDVHLMQQLEQMYPASLINNSHIIRINNHYFIFNKQDAKQLTEQHFDILSTLSENKAPTNPIYVEMDKNGKLLIY